MKLDKVGFVVTHRSPDSFHAEALGLCFDDGSALGNRDIPKRHIGTSLFYDESVTVFERRGAALAALKRTAKFRFKGEMSIVPVNVLKSEL